MRVLFLYFLLLWVTPFIYADPKNPPANKETSNNELKKQISKLKNEISELKKQNTLLNAQGLKRDSQLFVLNRACEQLKAENVAYKANIPNPIEEKEKPKPKPKNVFFEIICIFLLLFLSSIIAFRHFMNKKEETIIAQEETSETEEMGISKKIADISIKVDVPKREGKGEDAPPLIISKPDSSVIAVFDGMGGAGAKTYTIEDKTYTGAYLASRMSRKAVESFFEETELNPFNGNLIKGQLESAILNHLKTMMEKYNLKSSSFKSKLIKTLPTTAAILYNEYDKTHVLSHVFWAGDSRCYALELNGLRQLSKDDLVNDNDAMSNILNDAPLSNCITADGPCKLHYLQYKFDAPVILFTATDGAFGFLQTPMHFEYLLLSTLNQADSETAWKDNIINTLKNIAADDIAIGIVGVGFENFDQLKQMYLNRLDIVQLSYINKYDQLQVEIKDLQKTSNDLNQALLESLKEQQQHLWRDYKPQYEQFNKAI